MKIKCETFRPIGYELVAEYDNGISLSGEELILYFVAFKGVRSDGVGRKYKVILTLSELAGLNRRVAGFIERRDEYNKKGSVTGG